MSKSPLKINLDSLKQRKEWKRHKVIQGNNIYRILPPFGENSDGYAYRRWVIAWLTDPQTGRRRPYASPRSFGEDACPVSQYISLLEKKKEELENSLRQEGFDKDQIRERLKPITDIIWTTKPKASYIYNATNKEGEVGLLELKKTAHDEMKKQMMQYVTDYGQDPTSLCSDSDDSGVWFNIKREGERTSTKYYVVKNQTKRKIENSISWVDDREPLPDNIAENYENLGYDLTNLYKRVSYDELLEVLNSNLSLIYQETPEAMVEGFDLATGESTPVITPKTTKKPIKVKFDDNFDDDEHLYSNSHEVKVSNTGTSKTVQPTTTATNSQDDEIFAYAESLLDD